MSNSGALTLGLILAAIIIILALAGCAAPINPSMEENCRITDTYSLLCMTGSFPVEDFGW